MYIRKLRDNIGMFSNVNNIIRHCIYEDKYDCPRFYVKWYSKLYQKDKYNLWEKYFEQPYFNKGDKEYKYYGNVHSLPKIRETLPKYIMPSKNKLTYPPINKEYIHKIISKRIIFKKFLIEKKNSFINKFKNKYLIGLHIRGAGHQHSGNIYLKKRMPLTKGIPLDKYILCLNNKIKELKKQNIDYKIIIFTDNNFVINFLKDKYDIEYYDAVRSEEPYGEIHVKNKNLEIKEKIAEDILVETLIMSELDFYIHGQGNIPNFVLCKNPKLKNLNIYKEFLQ